MPTRLVKYLWRKSCLGCEDKTFSSTFHKINSYFIKEFPQFWVIFSFVWHKWLLGYSCGFLEMVTFRDQETRLSIIEKHVPKSSNVRFVSDGWASYYWLKNWICSMKGIRPSQYPGYLAEFQFRYNQCGVTRANCWIQFIDVLKDLYDVTR